MSSHIYKYLSHSHLEKVLGSNNLVTLKCSYPKDFNDPYELFLTVNFADRPEVLAFYADVIGNLDQLPTTCFSRSPSVTPMWAHYAQNLQGFAIEINEEVLAQHFKESGFGDVDYRDAPDEDLIEMLYRAYAIGKMRHIYLLRRGVFSSAYYTKASCWKYEQERRMIVRPSDTRRDNNSLLIDIPKECIKSLICGAHASDATKKGVFNKSSELGCNFYEMKIGKSTTEPFFLDSAGHPYSFDGTCIKQSENFCSTCKEPLAINSKLCSWCRINDTHKTDAANRNSYRMLDHYGLLDEYVSGMDDITLKFRNHQQ